MRSNKEKAVKIGPARVEGRDSAGKGESQERFPWKEGTAKIGRRVGGCGQMKMWGDEEGFL